MALINCPECNQEVSDSANSCPKCGYPLKESALKKVESSIKENKKSYRKILIIAGIVIVAVIAMIVYAGMPHGKEEKLVKMVVEDIQDDLLVPESMEVLECYTYCIDASLEEGTGYDQFSAYDNVIYCNIYYKATNKSGGITDEVKLARIKDGELYFYLDIDRTTIQEAVYKYGVELARFSTSAYEKFNLTDHTERANKWVK